MTISVVTIHGLNFAITTSDWSNGSAAKNCAAAMCAGLRKLAAVDLMNLHAVMSQDGADGEDPRLDIIYKIETSAWRSATANLPRQPLFGHSATITAA